MAHDAAGVGRAYLKQHHSRLRKSHLAASLPSHLLGHTNSQSSTGTSGAAVQWWWKQGRPVARRPTSPAAAAAAAAVALCANHNHNSPQTGAPPSAAARRLRPRALWQGAGRASRAETARVYHAPSQPSKAASRNKHQADRVEDFPAPSPSHDSRPDLEKQRGVRYGMCSKI